MPSEAALKAPGSKPLNITSWADQMDNEDGVDVETLPPPLVEMVDKNTKRVIEFRRNDDGKLEKVTRHYKIQKLRVPKAVAVRKNWKKYGAAANDPPGPQSATTVISEDIFMQFLSLKDNKSSKEADLTSKIGGMDKGQVKCRYCKMDHWSLKCPYKDKLGELNLVDSQEASASSAAAERPAGGKYVPPSLRAGGNIRGEAMATSRSKDEANTIRVTNLPEEIQDSDLKDLFGPFGRVTRIFLAKDKYTGQSKGFAFVSFDSREAAMKAIAAVNGFGYANLILNVEWAKPSTSS